MIEGMIYISIVYKVYRWETFISRPDKNTEAERFFFNWNRFTKVIDDQYFLLIIDCSYLLKAII